MALLASKVSRVRAYLNQRGLQLNGAPFTDKDIRHLIHACEESPRRAIRVLKAGDAARFIAAYQAEVATAGEGAEGTEAGGFRVMADDKTAAIESTLEAAIAKADALRRAEPFLVHFRVEDADTGEVLADCGASVPLPQLAPAAVLAVRRPARATPAGTQDQVF